MGNNADTVTKNLPRIADDQTVPGRQLGRSFRLRRRQLRAGERQHGGRQGHAAARGLHAVGPHCPRGGEGRAPDALAHHARRHRQRLPRPDRADQQGIPGPQPALDAHSRRAGKRVAPRAHEEPGRVCRRAASRHHHGRDLQPGARRPLVRHARPEDDSGQRRDLGLRHRCLRGEPVPAVHDALVSPSPARWSAARW